MTDLCPEQLTGLSETHLVLTECGVKMHPQAAAAFARMQQAAKQDGLTLKIISGFRSFERQAKIWYSKLAGERPVYDLQGKLIDMNQLDVGEKLHAVLLYSALPGASRHHWGTDVDIYDAQAVPQNYQVQLQEAEYSAGGPFYPARQWLSLHAGRFGFFFPYQEYQGGVAAEPWHISYQPISSRCEQLLSCEVLKQCIVQHPIAQQNAVLNALPVLYSRYVRNICRSSA